MTRIAMVAVMVLAFCQNLVAQETMGFGQFHEELAAYERRDVNMECSHQIQASGKILEGIKKKLKEIDQLDDPQKIAVPKNLGKATYEEKVVWYTEEEKKAKRRQENLMALVDDLIGQTLKFKVLNAAIDSKLRSAEKKPQSADETYWVRTDRVHRAFRGRSLDRAKGHYRAEMVFVAAEAAKTMTAAEKQLFGKARVD